MINRSYWTGVSITVLAVLIVYQWPGILGRPRPEFISIHYALLPGHEHLTDDYQDTRANAANLRLVLEERGIRFPPESLLDAKGYWFSLHNTRREHRKLRSLKPPMVHESVTYKTHLNMDLTIEIEGRTYGIQESRMFSIRYADGVTRDLSPPFITQIKLGTPADLTNPILPDPINVLGSERLFAYTYRAWPALLALTLIPYTLIFILRRPIGRVVANLNLRRRITP